MKKTRRLTLCAILIALALGLSYMERFIPLNLVVPLPGVKLGLANIVTVFTVFAFRGRDGAAVLAVRVFLGAVFAGNFSTIFYSAAGGILAIGVTIGLKRILTENQLWDAVTSAAV